MKIYASNINAFKDRASFNKELALNAKVSGNVNKVKAGGLVEIIPLSPATVEPTNHGGVQGEGYGIAVMQLRGMLVANTDDLYDWFAVNYEGGTDLQEFYHELSEVASDPRIKAIIIEADSGGGDVNNTQLVANLVRDIDKPVIGFVTNLAASACYWILSQCDSIYVATETTSIGSIGVYTAHVDNAGYYEMIGKQVTYIPASQSTEKIIGADNKPLSESDFAKIQERVSKLAAIFINQVEQGRGGKLVGTEYQNGSVFIASDAIANGLVDGYATAVEIVNNLSK